MLPAAKHALKNFFMKGKVINVADFTGLFFFFFYFKKLPQAPNLQQPSLWSDNIHHHSGKSLHQQKDEDSLKA